MLGALCAIRAVSVQLMRLERRSFRRRYGTMNFLLSWRERAAPFRDVLPFNSRYWRRQRLIVAAVCMGILLMTMADVLLPIYAGRLIDAVAPVATSMEAPDASSAREAALNEAVRALAA